jgi:hypothetical protein
MKDEREQLVRYDGNLVKEDASRRCHYHFESTDPLQRKMETDSTISKIA